MAITFLKALVRFGVFAVLAAASFFVCSHYVVKSVQVSGNSMVPTLHDGDQYMLSKWAYALRTPQRGEVVVLKDPEDHGFDIKRIIAVGGDTVRLKGGAVYVNNEKLTEPYLIFGTTTHTLSKVKDKVIFLGKDRYFVLGDNRWHSTDSRIFGAIGRESILGLIRL